MNVTEDLMGSKRKRPFSTKALGVRWRPDEGDAEEIQEAADADAAATSQGI
jgi:hypothetical protein